MTPRPTSAGGAGPTRARDLLALGRVSNLPTVWSNVLAASALALASEGGAWSGATLAGALVALSLMYVGGMYLNDACDAEIDARERPERPIPSGRIARATVFRIGFGLLASAVLVLMLMGWAAGVAALGLAAAVVAYNLHHKGFALSPVVMGVTRLLVYVAAGAAMSGALMTGSVWLAGAALLSWIIGLTYAAKQERIDAVRHVWPLVFLAAPIAYGLWRATEPALVGVLAFTVALTVWALHALRLLARRAPGDAPRAVTSLIAGVALVDAVVAAGAGAPGVALVCVGLFVLTRMLQRHIAGT